jgi:hypothetical protein
VKGKVPDERKELTQSVVAYALSFVTGGLGFFLLFLLREMIIMLLRHSTITHWAWTAIDNFSLLIYVAGWLVAVLASHHYYRQGLRKGVVLKRFLLVTGIELLLYFVIESVPGFVGIGDFATRTWALIVLQGVAGIGLIVLAKQLPMHKH